MIQRGTGPDMHVDTIVVRHGRLIAFCMAAALVPWIVLLGATLPDSTRAYNWSMAWIGLDAAEAIAALSTALLIRCRAVPAALTATVTGTLLIADAWFDVCTSAPGSSRMTALIEAFGFEVPLALGAFGLAWTMIRRAGAVDPSESVAAPPTPTPTSADDYSVAG